MSYPEPQTELDVKPGDGPSDGATAVDETDVSDTEHEESIEQYMAALLDRVRGLTTAAGGPSAERGQSSASVASAQTAASVRGQTANTASGDPAAADVTPQVRRPARAPVKKRCAESADEVSAMRGLANLNAYLAIQTHSIRQLIVDARRILAFAAAIILATFLFLRTEAAAQPLGCLAAVGATVVAAACCLQYFRITREMTRRARAGCEEPAAKSTDADAAATRA
jgi:hypothetical protein